MRGLLAIPIFIKKHVHLAIPQNLPDSDGHESVIVPRWPLITQCWLLSFQHSQEPEVLTLWEHNID